MCICHIKDRWVTQSETYSFLRADLRFSSLSSWAASLSLTSDPGALAGMMSNCRSLLCKIDQNTFLNLCISLFQICLLIYSNNCRAWKSLQKVKPNYGLLHEDIKTYSFVGIRRDAEGFLQWCAVLVHTEGEVTVTFVHSRHPLLDLRGMGVAFIAEPICQLYQQLNSLFGLLRRKEENFRNWRCPQGVVCKVKLYLGCDVEVLMFFQKLLRVVNAGARGHMCGEIELACVVDPLQGLNRQKKS